MKQLPLCLFSFLVALNLSGMEESASPISIDLEQVLLERIVVLIDVYKNDSKAKKPIISIAGGSSVGKTYFSKKLSHKLKTQGIRAKILSLDSFFEPSSQLSYSLKPFEFNSRTGCLVWQFDHRNAHQVIGNIAAREETVVEPYLDLETKIKSFISEDYSEIDVVIVEGIYALSGSRMYDLAQYSSLKIFMDVDKKRLFSWYCERKRNKNHPNPEEDPITAWDFDEDYEKVIAPSKENADMILKQDENREYYL